MLPEQLKNKLQVGRWEVKVKE